MALCLEPKILFKFFIFLYLLVNLRTWVAATTNENNYIGESRESQNYFLRLIPGKEIQSFGKRTHGQLDVFCQDDVPKSILYLWRDAHVRFVETPPDFKLYNGENVKAVIDQYKSEAVWHPATWISWKGTTISFPAFGAYCVGVKINDNKIKYSLQLVVKTVNYWKIVQFCIGLMLFYNAEKLSRNTVFHYTSGVSVGVMASVLVLMYILSKFIPKKSLSYLVILVSYSLVFYYVQLFYNSLQSVIEYYSTFLLAYIVLASITSFLLCYRFGPVSNPKTVRIIQWGIQLLSLLLIFFSTEYREVSTAVIMVILSLHVLPQEWVKRAKVVWYRKFPPKIKLLTEEEYNHQGVRETQRALSELRQYCNSPECKAWSTIQRLKDPIRFAKFVEGSSEHLTDAELLEYDLDGDGTIPCILTDDDNESENENITSISNHVSR